MRLVLASQSPRRKAILRFAGIPFKTIKPSGVVERRRPGEGPSELVQRLAVEKAMAVAKIQPQAWVLGADTVVACQGRIFGKPRSQGQAQAMLRRLLGKSHTVWTGAALVGKGGRVIRRHVEKTKVFFKRLDGQKLEAYLNTKEPYDKAGAYAIQGTARTWIEKWEGDYFNVMGLPLKWVVEETNRLLNRSRRF